MIELPRAPHDVTLTELSDGNSDPIDVLGARNGTATLALCNSNGDPLHFVFSPTDDLVDAEDAMPVPRYIVREISKQTRYMTVFSVGASVIYWYVV